VLLALLFVAAAPLSTVAEQSDFVRTGRYDEVITLCDAFAKKYPGRVTCESFGTTPEGRPMKLLIASSDGTFTPALANKRARPVVFFEGGIHAGEIDGKDAGFLVLREILDRNDAVLKEVTILFVPVFNIDGHERVGPNHRPNQRGPEQMGWRVTSQNLNLNRDWAKADAPEMRAMLALISKWDPALLVDLHVTDGAKFQHDVAVLIEPVAAGPEPLMKAAKTLSDKVQVDLKKSGHLALDRFYPAFDNDDPSEGFNIGVAPPRLSSPYWSLRNRLGILVETHSWKPYKTRVMATRDVLRSLLSHAATDAKAWKAAGVAADAERPSDMVLAWDNDGTKEMIDFLGYHYERVRSEVSGGLWTQYDETKPEIWRVPLLTTVKPVLTAKTAKAYVIPPQYAWLGERLALHGISFEVLSKDRPLQSEVYRATTATFGTKPYESHQTLKVQGKWQAAAQRTALKGSLYVRVDQAKSRLLSHLLEPEAPDSYAAWGFFNAHFEQKEYMEPYVAEEEARKMMAADPSLKAAFETKLYEDVKFRDDHDARLDFFYRRHPAYDAKMNEYPVLRVP
jgi:hypothetical protein